MPTFRLDHKLQRAGGGRMSGLALAQPPPGTPAGCDPKDSLHEPPSIRKMRFSARKRKMIRRRLRRWTRAIAPPPMNNRIVLCQVNIMSPVSGLWSGPRLTALKFSCTSCWRCCVRAESSLLPIGIVELVEDGLDRTSTRATITRTRNGSRRARTAPEGGETSRHRGEPI